MSHDDAIKTGAMALFGEKNGGEVRVLKWAILHRTVWRHAHVRRTGDIGFFKIIAEGGVAAGRRIEAVTVKVRWPWCSNRTRAERSSRR